MYFTAATVSFAAMSFFGMATAQTPPGDAIVTVENLRTHVNSTVPVPIGQVFSGDAALDAVSTLYLTGSTGVSIDTITCTPYLYADGTGDRGEPFSFGKPSRLDLNTVVVGSLVCDIDQ